MIVERGIDEKRKRNANELPMDSSRDSSFVFLFVIDSYPLSTLQLSFQGRTFHSIREQSTTDDEFLRPFFSLLKNPSVFPSPNEIFDRNVARTRDRERDV